MKNKKIWAKAIGENRGQILIYGDISDDKYWDDEVTPKEIVEQLDNLGDITTLDLRINSYGGSVSAGNTMFNIIDNYKKRSGCTVVSYIDGIAASMAGGLAMVGDKIIMAANSVMGLHKPLVEIYGNAEALRKQADILDIVEEGLVTNYMRHFKGTKQELQDILADETWLSAKAALEKGFCTEISSPVEVEASAKGLKIGNFVFDNKTAEKFRDKFPNVKEVEDEIMQAKYNAKLADFGITEENFKALETAQDLVNEICKFTVPAAKEEFISANKAKEVLGSNETADTILSAAKAYQDGKESFASNEKKAKAYNKLLDEAKKEALNAGFKAKGDNFNSEKWEKIFENFSLEEIMDQKKEWIEDAEIVLKAGKRVSKPKGAEEPSTLDGKNTNF